MRPTAVIPALCCAAALILSFLCLFAGHKESFMEDYHVMTVNTSLLGETILEEDRASESDSSNIISNLWDRLQDEVSERVNDKIGEVTARLGIEDWYSMHLLNYCEGQYLPGEVANETVSEDDISKSVSNCSESRAMFHFDPTAIIQQTLDENDLDVTLEDLKWPDDIQDGIDALNALMGAMFVLYVLAICLIFVSLLAAAFALFASGRLSACVNFLLAILAFLAIGLASALVTAVMVKATDIINEYGNDIGVEAKKGGKFLALTWAATALMFIVMLAWVAEFFMGRRQKKRASYAKHG